jgi:hypothetical protein
MRGSNCLRYLICFLLLCGNLILLSAQGVQQLSNFQNGSFGSGGRGPNAGGSKKDSLQKRDRFIDSITIFYRYFDSTRNRTIDSSINDFTTRFPLPYSYHHLGNYGTAAQSLLFNPLMKAGFDAGFHQYDIYQFSLANTKFYQTTRPYTELAYLLGSKAEQLIDLKHTQNRKTNFNFGIEYRFSNAPGFLKNQNVSHNNFRFTSHYQTNNRRYEFFLVLLSNKAASSENGGLVNIKQLDSLALNNPYELETRMGKEGAANSNPFNTTVTTGNIYRETDFLYRHHYDFGKKDSIVTDSLTYKIFYPRFRIEHDLKITQQEYQFFDNNVDSARYKTFFNYNAKTGVNSRYLDKWNNIQNVFSLLTFPDKNNQSQFFKASIALQNLIGQFDTVNTTNFYNVYTAAEYRNRTKNQVWDIEANGQLFINGLNAGDYSVFAIMKRRLGKKYGFLSLGFQNVNRSPSFNLNPLSSFPLKNKRNFAKENTIRLFVNYENPKKHFKFGAEYFAVNNFMYFDSFYTAKQEATLFNVLHVSAEKMFKIAKHWNWYTEVHIQQTTGNPPINIPFFLTRNRIAFEGNFYTNLFISTGFELRYHAGYKADNYSPQMGQYFFQNTNTINNRPDINAFLHFRIKSFKGFLRAENLNTLSFEGGNIGFTKRNLMANDYVAPGLMIRFGVWWNFIN